MSNMASVSTTKTTQELEKRVLAWVNLQRMKLLKLQPLKRLPRGYPRNPIKCTIAKSLPGVDGPTFGPTQFSPDGRTIRKLKKIPDYVKRFIAHFDAGKLPHLVIRDRK